MTSAKIVVTGADGFVGQRLCARLEREGWDVRKVIRRRSTNAPSSTSSTISDLTEFSDWPTLLDGARAVVHLAAMTHSGGLRGGAALERYRSLNVDVSGNLARAAQECGVSKFVYMSSIKVNGESSRTADGRMHAFSPSDVPAPIDNYGRTKWEAEKKLDSILAGSSTQLTILRPPLIFGPGQKANIQRLMRAVAREATLPFGGLENRRSYIYVDNLAAAVALALRGHDLTARTYTLADVTLSTPELILAMAKALGVPVSMPGLPRFVYRGLELLPGIGPKISRLTGDLAVDSSAAIELLGWRSEVEFEAALAVTAAWLRQEPA